MKPIAHDSQERPRMPERDPLGLPSLIAALRSGRAGFVPRVALSLASVAILVAFLMFFFGLADQTHRVQDEHVAVGLGLAGVVWCGVLMVIWATYGRWRHVLSTVFICLGVVVATIAVASLVGVTLRNPEFIVASIVFLGIGALIAIIAAAVHRGSRGRAILTTDGAIDVRCPQCAYSMTGLDSTKCPECGHHPTIDQLIRAQDYEGVARAAAHADERDAQPHTAPTPA